MMRSLWRRWATALTLLQLCWVGSVCAAAPADAAFDMPYFNWQSLQLSDAIMEIRGNGSRKIAVFTDPDCGYCRKYEQTLAQADNLTIYRFLTPISESGTRKSVQIWCSSADNRVRLQVLQAVMRGEPMALPKGDCPNPVQSNVRFAKSQDIYFTPSTVNRDGRIAKGYLPFENFQRWLSGKPAFQ